MFPFDVIRKYYPNASEEELKQIQESVYLLCCGLMQYFYGDNWEEDMGDPDLEIMSSNPVRVLQFYFHTPLISFNFFSLDQPLI
jgi:hypothetical protein